MKWLEWVRVTIIEKQQQYNCFKIIIHKKKLKFQFLRITKQLWNNNKHDKNIFQSFQLEGRGNLPELREVNSRICEVTNSLTPDNVELDIYDIIWY